MPGLQEWIHKIEEGEWVRHIKLAAAALALLALTAWYDLREFKSFSTQEAMDTAQLARNISEGHGYTTQFIRPFSILLLQRQMAAGIPVLKNDHHPDLANAPLYPMVLAGLMKVLPFQFDMQFPFTVTSVYQPELLIALFNQLLFFASAFLVFRLALRLFDSAVAWLSSVTFVGTDLFWRFSISGLSTMLLVLIFLGIVWCLVSMEHNQREGQRSTSWFVLMAALVGVLVGLGGLTRYSFALVILPVALFLGLFLGNRRSVAGIAVAASLVVLAPWIIRNYMVSHTPFGVAGYAVFQDTDSFPGNRLERYFGGNFETEKANVGPSVLIKKLLVNGADMIQTDLPKLGGSWLSGFFLVSLFIPFRNAALNRLRVFLLAALAVWFVSQALGRTHLSHDSPEINSENLLAILAPLALIYGAGLFFVLLEQLEVSFPPVRSTLTIGFTAIICLPLILALLPPRTYPPTWPPYWPPRIQEASRWLNEKELMMSDMPWAVAWYGDRKCVWVTLDAPSDKWQNAAADFYSIYDHQKAINALYLTTLTTDAKFNSEILWARDGAWGRFVLESLWDKAVPTGFPLKQSRPGFIQDGQLFLTDRKRWGNE